MQIYIYIEGPSVNANRFSNIYTGDFAEYNFYIDSGNINTFSNVTAQGGCYGVYLKSGSNTVIDGLYTENVAHPIVLGEGSSYPNNFSLNNLALGGPYSTHPHAADRIEAIYIHNAAAGIIKNVNFSGCYTSATTVSVTGDGSGAILIARMRPSGYSGTTPVGSVDSIEILNGGSGYSSATISITSGSGSGASYTANLTDGVITSVTKNNAGSGYEMAQLPIAIRYYYPKRIVIDTPYVSYGSGSSHGMFAHSAPVFPLMVRITGAVNDAIEIRNDGGAITSTGNGTVYVKKSADSNHYFWVESVNDTGSIVTQKYTPPVY